MELDRYLSPFFPKWHWEPQLKPARITGGIDFEATRSPPSPSKNVRNTGVWKDQRKVAGRSRRRDNLSPSGAPTHMGLQLHHHPRPGCAGRDGRCSNPRRLKSPDVEENSHASTETAQQLLLPLWRRGGYQRRLPGLEVLLGNLAGNGVGRLSKDSGLLPLGFPPSGPGSRQRREPGREARGRVSLPHQDSWRRPKSPWKVTFSYSSCKVSWEVSVLIIFKATRGLPAWVDGFLA